MNRTILDKTTIIEDNLVIITEKTETKLNKEQLEYKLRNLQMQKERLREQNARVVAEYNDVVQEEIETNNLIAQLNINEGIKEI